MTSPATDSEVGRRDTAGLDTTRLDTIGLDELMSVADLQQRRDRKYLVPADALTDLVAAVESLVRVLAIDDRTRFAYRSTYFDTPEMVSYLDSARRRPNRFKVRTRHYVDTDRYMLEVKTRDRRRNTLKRRVVCEASDAIGLNAAARRFVAATDQAAPFVDRLRPELATTYHRTTLVVADGDPARITIDTDLTWRDTGGSELTAAPWAVIETKTTGRPCPLDHVLWRSGHRPIKISKYGTGRAALDPSLPANKWHRILEHRIGRAPRADGPCGDVGRAHRW